MPHQTNRTPIENSVFYSRKSLDNDTELVCRADLEPYPDEHRCGYGFTIALERGDETVTECLSDVTCDQDVAEELFNLLVSFNVSPLHLRDVTEDYLVSLSERAAV